MGRREGDTERNTLYTYIHRNRERPKQRETQSEKESESDNEESKEGHGEWRCFSWSKRPPEVSLGSFKRKPRGISSTLGLT